MSGETGGASPSASSSAQTTSLRRELRLADAASVGLGAIIGAGIFVVTGVAAGVAGPAMLVSLALACVAALCNALSSAQLAAAYPHSGGTYEYGYIELHPWFGFAAGWMFLASKLSAASVVALGFAHYLAALYPPLPVRLTGLGAVAALTALNCAGIRKTGRLNTIIVSVTAASLLCFIACGLFAVRASNFTPFAPFGWSGVLQGAALLFFAFTGYARIATLGEEVHDPARTIPRAILGALGIAALLYLGAAYVAIGAAGAPALSESASPLQQAARALPYPRLSTAAITVGAITAMLGVLLSQILGISRMMLAMARRADLPAPLARVHSRYQVPHVSIILTGIMIAMLVATGEIKWVVSSAAFTILVYYGITNAAALRTGPANKRFPDWIPAAGLTLCVLLGFSLEPATVIGGAAVLAVGVIARLVFRRLA